MNVSLGNLIAQRVVPPGTILVAVMVNPTMQFSGWEPGDDHDIEPDLHESVYPQDVLIVPPYRGGIPYGDQLRQIREHGLCPLAYSTLFAISQQNPYLPLRKVLAMGSIRGNGAGLYVPVLWNDRRITRKRFFDRRAMDPTVWTIVALPDK
jgi:hypothetical protein